MQKKTRALSGASQDAYFRRVFKAYPNLSADERERLVRRLRQEIAQLRLRRSARDEAETPAAETPPPSQLPRPSPQSLRRFLLHRCPRRHRRRSIRSRPT